MQSFSRSSARGAALVFVVLLSGCSLSVQFTPLNQPPHAIAPKPASAVDVMTAPPGRPYVEIGTLNVIGNDFAAPADEVIAEMRQEAANRGCDAVLVHDWSGACVVCTGK